MGLINGNGGNYSPQENGKVWNIQDNMWDKYVASPVIDWFNVKIANTGEWLKINVLDLCGIIVLAIIISTGLKMFIVKKEKDIPTIYYTIVIYTIIRLFWKVVLHV